MVSFKSALALLFVGLIVLSGCAQQQAPTEPVKEPTPAPVVEEPVAPPVVAPAPQPTPVAETPVAQRPESPVGTYTGPTEQTASNQNASYWDCVKSKLGNNFASASDEQIQAANRACVGYK